MRDCEGAFNPGESEYSDFLTFYKETLNFEDTNGNDEIDSGRQNFPRLQHNHIEQFQYYTADKFNSTFSLNIRQLSTLSINVRGIDCNYDNLLLFLNSINYNIDAIILTECHIQHSNTYNYDLHNTHPIEGYDKFYIKSPTKRRN